MVNESMAEAVVAYLNELLELDRPAVAALISNRVPCNEALADHPTCQVGKQHGGFNVGMLGLLNGLCGFYEDGPRKGFGPIAAEFEDDPEQPNEFRTLARFSVLKNEAQG